MRSAASAAGGWDWMMGRRLVHWAVRVSWQNHLMKGGTLRCQRGSYLVWVLGLHGWHTVRDRRTRIDAIARQEE